MPFGPSWVAGLRRRIATINVKWSVMSILSRFFQFLSKTDRRVIIYCTDHSVKTQVTNGVFVLLTGLFAFLSSMYAVYTTTSDFKVAIPVAVLYATVIIFIDREIVSAGSRRAALVRLPLAFVIGLVISVPLEMRLFAKRIDEQLIEANKEKNKGARDQMEADERAYESRIQKLEQEMEGYRLNMAEASQAIFDETVGRKRDDKRRTGLSGCGPACKAAQAQLEDNAKLLRTAEGELEKLKLAWNDVHTRIKETYEGKAIPMSDDLLARYEALEKVKASSESAIYMARGVMLLIILLEMFPALVKLMQRPNEYNIAVEEARRVNIARTIALAKTQIDQIKEHPLEAPKPTLMERLRENPFSS
jgi:hypothetical protein